MRAKREVAVAALVAMGLAGGAWAGIDAAAQVDGYYRAPPPRSIRVPAATPWRPADDAPTVAAPPAGTVWGRDIGPDERAMFDTAPERDASQPRPQYLPVERVPVIALPDPPVSNEGEGAWVQAPVPSVPSEEPPPDGPVE